MLNQIKKDLARINKSKYDSIIFAINELENTDDFVTETVCECCSHCGEEIEMNYNVAESGFTAICPECGEKLMLCSECTYIFEGRCDWNAAENSCFADKISSSICIHHHREAQLRKDVESMLRNAISDDYTSRILDIILEDCVNNVKTSSAYEEDGYYNMDDIRLAIGRTLLSKLEE